MEFIESNGASIPALGFGTYRLAQAEAESMVEEALAVGYRHVDTAQMYGNESGVGRGLRRSGVNRDDVFLTTKIWPDDFERDSLLSAVRRSLSRLDVDHVDLVLLHWPSRGVPLEETISALNESRGRGDTRHIGVSNFDPRLLSEAAEASDAPLVNDQVEYHPFKDQSPVLEAARGMGVSVTAYSPLAKSRVSGDETLRGIGKAHGKNEGQVALRWLVQQGVIAIPKTASPERCRSNFEVFDFELSEEEMGSIGALSR